MITELIATLIVLSLQLERATTIEELNRIQSIVEEIQIEAEEYDKEVN